MPLPIYLAHGLARRLAEVRRSGLMPQLKPDGKTQVGVAYDGFIPLAVRNVLISTQHTADAEQERLRSELFEHVLRPVLPAELCVKGRLEAVEFLANPSGRFVQGGPEADSGLTGRKIIVDTYGGMARHGGGSFSGKDPTKVDRSASYYARYIAKNLVAAGAAERLELQVSYAIGRARPLSIAVDCQGTALVDEGRILSLLEHGGLFDFRPAAIIERLGLLDVRYEPVAAYGHFGRTDLDLPWERLDLVDAIRQELKL
jgi:S-adenosylmethionine synthetase